MNTKHRFYYGATYQFTDEDKSAFSHKGYECKAVMKDRKGKPVAILQSTNPELPIWKVMYGYSTVFFGTYDEALAFCTGRFSK